MSESPTPGRIDGRLGLAIGIVGSAALVIGVWLYALYGGSTTSAPPIRDDHDLPPVASPKR